MSFMTAIEDCSSELFCSRTHQFGLALPFQAKLEDHPEYLKLLSRYKPVIKKKGAR